MTPSATQYFHPSNLITYLSLMAGLLAIVSVKRFESLAVAGGLIALCALADALDGKFARLFKRTESQEQFGVQLDSLTDALAFGLAPVVSFYLLVPFESSAAHLIWLAAAFFYLLSAITRLGFYNIHRSESSGFIGLPTTVAGLLWSSFFLTSASMAGSVVLLIGCGIAMVSSVPIARPRRLGIMAIVAWAILLVILHGASILMPTKHF